jgi:hypothetical protein
MLKKREMACLGDGITEGVGVFNKEIYIIKSIYNNISRTL